MREREREKVRIYLCMGVCICENIYVLDYVFVRYYVVLPRE